MDRLFSTTKLHPRDRFDCWHEIACKQIIGHDSWPQNRPTFDAELCAASVAQVGILRFQNSAMRVKRTTRHIARAVSDDLFVCLQQASSVVLTQNDRDVTLRPNDFCLLDPRIPYAGAFANNSQMVAFKVPRSMLEARLGKSHSRGLRALGSGPLGQLTASYLALLPMHAARLEGGHDLIKEQALDLIALCVGMATEDSAFAFFTPRTPSSPTSLSY